MADASVVDTKVPLKFIQVNDVPSVQAVLPYLSHNEELIAYVLKMYRDPDTLIVSDGGRGLAVVSIMEHPFSGRIAVLAWAQNPDKRDWKDLRRVMWVLEKWSKDKGAQRLCSFVGPDGPWENQKAYTRLTGLQPYRIVYAKEL